MAYWMESYYLIFITKLFDFIIITKLLFDFIAYISFDFILLFSKMRMFVDFSNDFGNAEICIRIK